LSRDPGEHRDRYHLPPALSVGPNPRFPNPGLLAGSGEFASARRGMAQFPGLDLIQPWTASHISGLVTPGSLSPDSMKTGLI